jgi:hypothetical protein
VTTLTLLSTPYTLYSYPRISFAPPPTPHKVTDGLHHPFYLSFKPSLRLPPSASLLYSPIYFDTLLSTLILSSLLRSSPLRRLPCVRDSAALSSVFLSLISANVSMVLLNHPSNFKSNVLLSNETQISHFL